MKANHIEVMKLALEALEVATTPLAKDRQEVLRARAAIREALAEQPASKPWVGLTDEDSQDVIQRAMHSITGGDNTFTLSANKIWVAIVREVEAKLRSKNEGRN